MVNKGHSRRPAANSGRLGSEFAKLKPKPLENYGIRRGPKSCGIIYKLPSFAWQYVFTSLHEQSEYKQLTPNNLTIRLGVLCEHSSWSGLTGQAFDKSADWRRQLK